MCSKPLFENYNIYAIQEKVIRNIELEKNLKNNLPKESANELLKLCNKYSNIFDMPGDPASVNNFYEQKLTLRDKVPVFVKNYRLPQTQKEEINR